MIEPIEPWSKVSPIRSYIIGCLCHCRCVITGNGGSSYAYLGRPWGPYGRVVFAYTYMDQCIKHDGWNNWGNVENERSACFYEYRSIVSPFSVIISLSLNIRLFHFELQNAFVLFMLKLQVFWTGFCSFEKGEMG